jgi:sugar O-acyltransferase (sialic acid O-acetyltransferase NeuD family)
MKNRMLFGLPVIPFEEIERFFGSKDCKAFVAISFTQLNRLRTRLFNIAKAKVYVLCSYISPRVFIGKNVEIGENCFIFENVTVQRNVKIGNNVTIWSGSFIGHRSAIGNNCFIASQVAISSFCDVGENCFFGVNSCVTSAKKIVQDCIVGAGAVVIEDTNKAMVYVGNPAKPLPNKNVELFLEGKEML